MIGLEEFEEDSQDLRPIELETHRRTPPPLDDEDRAEMSQISADIDDAEKFELTFEVVNTSAAEDEIAVEPVPDEEISKILTPPSADKKNKRIRHIDGNLDDEEEDFDEEGRENDENEEDGGANFRRPSMTHHRKSVANELLDEFHSPHSTSTNRKRRSDEPLLMETPKSGKKHHTSASELLDEFRSPLATSSSHNSSPSVGDSRKRSSALKLSPVEPIETPKRGAMAK